MLRYLNNNKGFMSLTLSSIGLVLASGILFLALFSIVFMNDGQRVAELERIATHFSAVFYGSDTLFYENRTSFQFTPKPYPYTVQISTEYLVVSAPGHWNTLLSVKHRFSIPPLPQNHTLNPNWKTGNDLHRNWLVSLSNHTGTITDPIDRFNTSTVQTSLRNLTNMIGDVLAKYPLQINTDEYVQIEKVMIYYDRDGDGIWMPNEDEYYSFILIYQ